MALPAISAGLRVATAIAKRVGKKLVKTSSYGGKGKYKYATATRGYKLKGPVGGIGRGLKREVKRSYFRGKGQVRKTLTTGEPFKGIAKETKRHLKFYSKVISPQGTQFKNLITRPTFGQRKLFLPGAKQGSKFAGTYVTRTTKGMKTRSKLLKGGIYGGYIYGASKLRS